MKKTNSMPLRRTSVATAVFAALAAMATSSAVADPLLTVKLFRDADIMFRDSDMARYADNYVELGAGYNSHDSFGFGQYSGLTDKGAFGIVNFNWQQRAPQNDTQYWRIFGTNLGLDSRRLTIEAGQQGLVNVTAGVDQLRRSEVDSASFLHDGLGSNNLTLPAGYTLAANATAIPPGSLRRFNIEQGRDIYRFGVSGLLAQGWDYKLSYREDRRDGSRLIGVAFQSAAARSALVPYAMDDQTKQIEATVGYADPKVQLQFAYAYSKFQNNLDRLLVANPYTTTTGGATAQMSLMPDNDFHQLSATGAYRINKSTLVTSSLTYAVARQNEAYLPYTLAGTVGTALPRGSLEGKVVNTQADVALNMRPVDKATVKLAYQYRDNDNQTPLATYLYASRDGNQPASSVNSGNLRQNAPLSSTEQRYTADGDYEVAPRTIVRTLLERKNVKYELADRSETNTDKLMVEMRRPVSAEFLGSVGYTYSQRRGSDYDKNTFFRNSYVDPTFQTSSTAGGGRLTNHPSTRSFMYGDFNENRLRASGSWTVSDAVSVQGGIDGYRQKAAGPDCASVLDPNAALAISGTLPDTCLGRTLAEGGSVNFDLQWQPDENFTTFAFLNLAQTGTEQNGRSWSRATTTTGGVVTTANTQGSDPNRDWSAEVRYRDVTVGAGAKWQPMEAWDLGATYVFTRGNGKVDVAAGSALTVADLPDTHSRMHTAQLFAKWDYSKALTWRFNYVYEIVRSYDWAYDGVATTSTNNVLLTGQTSMKYINQVFGVSAALKTW